MRLYSGGDILEKYSKDRSIYKIRPSYVCLPKNEKEIIEAIDFARSNGLSVTPRGGGTGLSGSSIGSGVILDLSKSFTKVYKIGKETRLGAGILLEDLNPKLRKAGYMLPSVPLQQKCAIGGNVNTRSIGPRALKYGTMDKQVKYLRGVLADGRIIDTSSIKTIPKDIIESVKKLQKEIKKDKKMVGYLRSRPMSAGGYNLLALVDYKDIKDVITHLLVGSVGTLVVLTEVTLTLPKFKEFESIYLVHFDNLDNLQKSLNKLIQNNVASIEYAEKDVVEFWDKEFRNANAIYTMIASFEDNEDIRKSIVGAIEVKEIGIDMREKLWQSRAGSLPHSEKQAAKMGMDLPSGVDDTCIHPKDFSKIRKEVMEYAMKEGIRMSSFGHLGVGSIHLRPMVDMKRYPSQLDKMGLDIFKILRKYNGTLVGEHNSGLCRSRYLPMESFEMYEYMKDVKRIFDKDGLLNPHVMFDLKPMTDNIGAL